MAENEDFKETFNWWYVLAILGALLAFPLMHVIAGWYVFFFSS